VKVKVKVKIDIDRKQIQHSTFNDVTYLISVTVTQCAGYVVDSKKKNVHLHRVLILCVYHWRRNGIHASMTENIKHDFFRKLIQILVPRTTKQIQVTRVLVLLLF
jgi:hypothetical protein